MIEDMFSVENDLEIVGDMDVTGQWQGPVFDGEWVRSGEAVTVSGPVVVYEGTEDLFPPSDAFTVTLHDNDNGTSRSPHVSGAPVNLTIQADGATDTGEVLTLILEDLPGTAQQVSHPTFELRVDGDAPTFTNPVPGPDDWHSSDNVLVSITADDTNTSGVDGSSLEYQYSTDGLDEYGEWVCAGLMTTANGPTVDGLVSLPLENGDDNYVRWRVKDRVGNGYAISDDLLIKVDTMNVTYSNPFPTDWQTSLEVLCGVTIHDMEGSGIDVSTIQLRTSPNNLSHYTHWRDWDEGVIDDAMTVDTSTSLEMAEGSTNYVQWRAIDIAGNGYTTSPHYRVQVDVTPIAFRDFTPAAEVFQNQNPVHCTAWAFDNIDGSGIDYDTTECRYRSDTNSEYTAWLPITTEGWITEAMLSVWLPMSDGVYHQVQFTGWDMAGNGPAYSEEYTVWVDTTPPSIELVDPVPGARLADTAVNITVFISDETSGVDVDNVWVRYSPPGPEEWTDWVSMQGTFQLSAFAARMKFTFEPGDGNRVQLQAYDNATNKATSEVFTFWVNRPPIAMIASPVDGGTLNDEELVAFSSSGSFDPDGDALEVSWWVESESVLELDGDEVERRLRPGSYVITVTVEDGYGGTDLTSITIEVKEQEKSSWADDWWWLLLFIILVIGALVVAYRVVLHQRTGNDADEVEWDPK